MDSYNVPKRTEKFGVRGKILKPEDVHVTEPALKGDFAGGVHFLDEAHLEPLAAVKILRKEADSLGGEVIEQCELLDFDFSNNRLKGIYSTKGRIEADQFVLAMGAWSKEFAKKVSLSIPILGGKGYGLIFPRLKRQPKIPLMILEKKIAVTPREDSIRVAGTLELVDQDFSVTPTRVKAIYNGALRHLDLPDQARVTEVWRGLRPCTSDGLPMIGRHQKINNLIFACGHQMLGLQTSLGTGKLVAEILNNKPTDLNLKILDPNRF
jgi:D-amino-acid dehydrogenase